MLFEHSGNRCQLLCGPASVVIFGYAGVGGPSHQRPPTPPRASPAGPRFAGAMSSRLQILVSIQAKHALERLAAYHGITQRNALENALLAAQERVLGGLTGTEQNLFFDGKTPGKNLPAGPLSDLKSRRVTFQTRPFETA